MGMIDLKEVAKPRKETLSKSYESEAPRYPYGLQITLDKGALKKLGFDISKIKVGSTINLTGKGKIVAVRQSERIGDNEQKSIEIQITHLSSEMIK